MTKMHIVSSVVIMSSLLAFAGCAAPQYRPSSAMPSYAQPSVPSGQESYGQGSGDSGVGNPALAYDKSAGKCVPYFTKTTRKVDYDACVAMMGNGAAGRSNSGGAVVATPGPMMAIPTGSGPICDAPMGTAVTSHNDSDFPVEVLSSDVAPLNCDAWRSTSTGGVTRPDGSGAVTRLIPPHTRSEWVYAFAMNGMVAQLPENIVVRVVAYRNLGIMVRGPSLGMIEKTWPVSRFPRGVDVWLSTMDFAK